MRGEFPGFRDWSIAAIWLLKGVVDSADERVWNLLLSNVSQLEAYFARLGLLLVVDEAEGLAFLRQFTDEETPEGYEVLPRLFHSSRFSYGQTLLCVMLRDEFRRFEEEDTQNERCVIDESVLLEQWKLFFPPNQDEMKQKRELQSSLRKMEGPGFVRRFSDEPPSWEIRRILKARLPADELETLRDQLAAAVERRRNGTSQTTED